MVQSNKHCKFWFFITLTTNPLKRRYTEGLRLIEDVRHPTLTLHHTLTTSYTGHSKIVVWQVWLWRVTSFLHQRNVVSLQAKQHCLDRMINTKCPYVGHGLWVRRRRTTSPLTTDFFQTRSALVCLRRYINSRAHDHLCSVADIRSPWIQAKPGMRGVVRVWWGWV